MNDHEWVIKVLEGILPEAKISIVQSPAMSDIRPDFEAEIILPNQRLLLLGEMIRSENRAGFRRKCEILQNQAASRPERKTILVAPYLSPERQKVCRERGIFFLDRSGNAFIRSGCIYIDKSGFPNLFPEKRKGRGIFSDKASLVLREMLVENRLRGVRELAASVGLDPGYVSRLVRELEQSGHLLRKNGLFRLLGKKSLLDDWTHIYDFRKNRESTYFCPAESPQQIIERLEESQRASEGIEYALTCHAGAYLVSPHARFDRVHIYAPEQSTIEIFVNALSLEIVDQGANVILLDPHYKNSFRWGMRQISNLNVVSDLQLYLDLHSYPLRGIEQAEFLYEKKLKSKIEGG